MNRMLILYIFLLLCGTVSAQQTVEWNDLQPLTDDAHRTVYYKKDSKRPLQGKYRIIRGLDEEHVKLSDGMINGDYHRYRDGVLRESSILKNKSKIGDIVEKGQVIAVIEASDKENENVAEIKKTEVTATIDGLLRGLIRDNYPVTKGFKIADIDPRKEELANCFTISDKARCIAGSVLEVICETLE